MSPWTANQSRESYHARIDQAVGYINANLAEEINLEQVARETAFSPFHFHRIFSALVGETPKAFVNRVRLEKAANLLLKSRAMSITDIALLCGFSSSATFARAFKQHFGQPASRYRAAGVEAPRQATEPDGPPIVSTDLARLNRLAKAVQVREMPVLRVAYVSNLHGYSLDKICAAWERLFHWAGARGWITPQTSMIGISFDDPFITPQDKCRYYACVTIPEMAPAHGPIGTLELPAGKYAVCRAECCPEEFYLLYQALYGVWLPDSGCQPADQPTYEVYLRTPENHPQGKFELEVCLPLA